MVQRKCSTNMTAMLPTSTRPTGLPCTTRSAACPRMASRRQCKVRAQAAAVETVTKAKVPLELEEGDLPLNTFSPKKPFKAKIKSVERISGPKATGETCHIIIDTKGDIPFWEGQSYGVIPPVSLQILFCMWQLANLRARTLFRLALGSKWPPQPAFSEVAFCPNRTGSVRTSVVLHLVSYPRKKAPLSVSKLREGWEGVLHCPWQGNMSGQPLPLFCRAPRSTARARRCPMAHACTPLLPADTVTTTMARPPACVSAVPPSGTLRRMLRTQQRRASAPTSCVTPSQAMRSP